MLAVYLQGNMSLEPLEINVGNIVLDSDVENLQIRGA